MTENYRRSYEMAPGRAETNVGMGWIHFFRRDNDQAYACFKALDQLRGDPRFIEILRRQEGTYVRYLGEYGGL